MSPYQELFKNIAFHANPGKRTLLKGGGGAIVPNHLRAQKNLVLYAAVKWGFLGNYTISLEHLMQRAKFGVKFSISLKCL